MTPQLSRTRTFCVARVQNQILKCPKANPALQLAGLEKRNPETAGRFLARLLHYAPESWQQPLLGGPLPEPRPVGVLREKAAEIDKIGLDEAQNTNLSAGTDEGDRPPPENAAEPAQPGSPKPSEPEGDVPPPASNPEEAPPGYPPLYITITKGNPEGSGDSADSLKGVPASQERIDELRTLMAERQYKEEAIDRELARYKELSGEQRSGADQLLAHGLELPGAIEVARAGKEEVGNMMELLENHDGLLKQSIEAFLGKITAMFPRDETPVKGGVGGIR